MEKYLLLLENGNFAAYEQVSENDVNIYSTSIEDASDFFNLENSRKRAKEINEGKSYGDLVIHSEYKVVDVVKSYGLG